MYTTTDPQEITPWEEHDGVWFKREDAFRLPSGVNGMKLRACRFLIEAAALDGYDTVVSAAASISPQSAIAASWAHEFGLGSITVTGGKKLENVLTKRPMQIAEEMGTEWVLCYPGYNPVLQSRAAKLAASEPGVYHLPYGISTSSAALMRPFVEVGAPQAHSLPESVHTLVVPFGSGNSAASILYGLWTSGSYQQLDRIVLMTIGPDQWDWLKVRLTTLLGTDWWAGENPLPIQRELLHPGFATYGDLMPEEWDGIRLHPTYEGKVMRWMLLNEPDWWELDGSVGFWIVGGPL